MIRKRDMLLGDNIRRRNLETHVKKKVSTEIRKGKWGPGYFAHLES
jgi:hypothetical protein